MGIQINGNTNNINAGIGSLSIEDINELDIVGVATAANFKTGVSNLHSLGLSLSGGQLDVGSNIKIGNAGVITATSFVGSGAQLTGITQTTINNNANNRVITGSGSANTLEGEANLTFNGGATGDAQLTVHAAEANANSDSELILETSNDFATSVVMFKDSTAEAGSIAYNHGDNYIKLSTNGTNGGNERLRIDSAGRCIVGGGTHAGGSALVVKGGNQNSYSTIGMFSNHTNPAVNTLITQIRFGSNISAVGAEIRAEADAAWGTNDYPTRLGFYTTPDGSNSRTERLRITKDGQIRIDQATSANNGIRMRPSGWNYDFRIGAVSSSGGSIWLGQNYEPTGGTRDSASYGTNYIQFTTGGDIHFGTGATNTNPTERLRIEADGDFRLSNDMANGYGYIRGWQASTGDMVIGADQSATGSSGSNLIFRTRGGERARIINSGGITFNGDTAAANALDDYEQGDITLTLVGTSGGSANYSYRTGHYTKIGNICHVTGDIRFNGAWSGSTGSLNLNLPFTAEATGGCVGAGIVSEWNLSGSNWDNIMIKVDNNESVARFTAHSGNNNNTSNFQTNLFGNGRYLKFAFTYQTQ